jgi:hypothetical protein
VLQENRSDDALCLRDESQEQNFVIQKDDLHKEIYPNLHKKLHQADSASLWTAFFCFHLTSEREHEKKKKKPSNSRSALPPFYSIKVVF